jgi:hypothetical protein
MALKKLNRKEQKKIKRETAEASKAIGATAEPVGRRPANKRVWIAWSLVVLILSGWMLFFNLGHYYLWYDEADPALFAKGIARTGDTSAVIDHNIYAYHNGSLLKNLRGRYQPPVPYFLAAPFVGADGTGRFWPRFPFAVCGLLSVGLLLCWMIKSDIGASAWIVMSIGLLGNVSFFLFCRQCRYFSLTILFSLAIVYLYLNWKGRWWEYAGIVLASILLLGTNYLSYAALYAALACDYLFFGHSRLQPKGDSPIFVDHASMVPAKIGTVPRLKLNLKQWLLLLGPQLIIGIITLWIFNPTGDEVAPDLPGRNILLDKLLLFWWNLRDLNASEFYVGIVMLAALPVYIWKRNIWLLRGIIAGLCYMLTVVIFSPQHVSLTYVANVRYLVPLIPLFIGLSALVIAPLAGFKWPLALVLAVIVFGANALNHPLSPAEWSCRPAEFVQELFTPQDSSLNAAVKWIEDNVNKGESIYVEPDHMMYPLMYHAPQPVYAWQLKYPPQKQFASLPPIHFAGQIAPDYIVVFGFYKEQMDRFIDSLKREHALDYRLIKVLDIFWADQTRPEILLRSFHTIKNFDRRTEAVYVYRRVNRGQAK